MANPTWRDCTHDGKFLACQGCLDESARRQIDAGAAKRDPSVDQVMLWYEMQRGKLHFARKAIEAAKLAGAGPRLIEFLERLRDDVAYVGD